MKNFELELNSLLEDLATLSSEYIKALKNIDSKDSVNIKYYAHTTSLLKLTDRLDSIFAKISEGCANADKKNDIKSVKELSVLLNMCLKCRSFIEEYTKLSENALNSEQSDKVYKLILYAETLTRKTVLLKSRL